ncbi:MAG: arsenate reductase [Rhodothermales bacterium]|jgi:arsenate reductase
MAEGLLRALHGDRYVALSAGTEATMVKPEAAEALAALGIDASAQTSKTIAAFDGQAIDYVITVCDSALETCPYFPATRKRVHRSFSDPSGETSSPEARQEAFHKSCAEIRVWIDEVFGHLPPNL